MFGPWSEGGFQITEQFPREAWLPRLTDLAKQFPDFGGLTVHLGLVFGLVAAVIVWFILKRTRWGFEIRLIGDNPRAARYAGVNIARNIIVVFMVSGGLAGLAGMSEVAGSAHVLQSGDLARLRLHGDHRGLPGQVQSVRRGGLGDSVRRADPGRPRDPAVRHSPDDPGRRSCSR